MSKDNDSDKREKSREAALETLDNEVYTNYAAAFNSRDGYGEAGKRAVHDFLYADALQNSGPELVSMISGSRVNGELYTGNLNELEILQYGAKIIQEALLNLKVDDVAEKLGYEGDLAKYKGKWMLDLMKSDKDDDKKVAQELVGRYMTQMTHKKVAEALNMEADSMSGGLEKIVGADDSKDKKSS